MNQRLSLVWPEFREVPEEVSTLNVPTARATNATVDKPWKRTRIHLAISEYRNKKWSAKKVSTDYLETNQYQQQTIDQSPYVLLPLDFTSFPEGKFLVVFHDTSTKSQAVFELLGCKGYPEKVANKNDFFPILTRFDRDRFKYLKNAENSVGDPLIPNTSLILVQQILDRTPDLFKITYPHYLSFFDKLFSRLMLLQQSVFAVSAHRYQYLTLGTFYDWFYADKARTFFVRPELLGSKGDVLFYKGLVELFEDKFKLLNVGRSAESFDKLKKIYEANYQFRLLFQNSITRSPACLPGNSTTKAWKD